MSKIGFIVDVDAENPTDVEEVSNFLTQVIQGSRTGGHGCIVEGTYNADHRETLAKNLVTALEALNRQLAEDEDQDTSQLHDDIFVAAQALVEHMGFTVKSEGDFAKERA